MQHFIIIISLFSAAGHYEFKFHQHAKHVCQCIDTLFLVNETCHSELCRVEKQHLNSITKEKIPRQIVPKTVQTSSSVCFSPYASAARRVPPKVARLSPLNSTRRANFAAVWRGSPLEYRALQARFQLCPIFPGYWMQPVVFPPVLLQCVYQTFGIVCTVCCKVEYFLDEMS